MSEAITRLNAALEGRYRIERELGEGGMAMVYLADDLRHERKVALKVLKPELAAVVGAERFLAEIKTTAGLQHPHILPLHDSGEADSFLFYVMPYVEGETLQERINREKQLPVDDAVRIATAVAQALQTAHEQGIVHRDIKPANILLSRGEPLVADFGIAIAVGAAGGSRLTETGLSVGTPFYMSPEQATGDQSVGPASDTYALACVLYEMLVGEPPYIGNTAQAVLGKIIQGDPVSATTVRRSIPANVDAAIRKALEKLPADRFAGAQQFADALADPTFRHRVFEGDGGVSAGGSRLRMYAGWGAAAVLAMTTLWAATRSGLPVTVERFSLALTEERSPNPIAALPDGSGFVFERVIDGQLQLWQQRWDNLAPTPVPGTENGSTPGVSPDGTELAFIVGAELRIAPLGGGVVRTVADSANCCPRWGPDGFVYYTGLSSTIHRVPEAGGASEQVTDRDQEGDGPQADFQVLPGGENAVFSVWGNPFRVDAMNLSSGERKTLVPGVKPYLTPTGHLVFGSMEGQILAVAFDTDAAEIIGSPVPLVDGMFVNPSSYPLFSVSENGTLVYWSGASGQAGVMQMVRVTRSGEATPIDPGWTFSRGDINTSWSISPDGTQLALREQTDQTLDIWIKQLPDGPRSRLTFDDAEDYSPVWSPDGATVTYVSGADPTALNVFAKAANGTGSAELLADLEGSVAQAVWSPDGEWLVLRTTTGAGAVFGRDIVALRPGEDSEPQPLMVEEFDETDPAISPDGRWIAYTSNETGRYEVYVRPFPDVDAGRWQVSTQGGFGPKWAHSGRELFFVDANENLSVAVVGGTDVFQAGSPEALFAIPADYQGSGAVTTVPYAVTPDDGGFVMARVYRPAGQEEEALQLGVVQNWLEDVKARVPR